MTYVLDTNVVSALRVPGRHPAVAAWADSVQVAEQFVVAITLAEIERGVIAKERTDPTQSEHLRRWFDDKVLRIFVFARRGHKPHHAAPSWAYRLQPIFWYKLVLDEKDPTSGSDGQGQGRALGMQVATVHPACSARQRVGCRCWWSSSLGQEVIRWLVKLRPRVSRLRRRDSIARLAVATR